MATPKRNPPREAAPSTCRPASVWRGQGAAPKPVRTLTASESESMRKVVPISKASRGPAGWKRPEPPPSRASPRDSPGSVDARLSRRGSALGTSDTSPRRPSTGAEAVVAVEEPRPPRSSTRPWREAPVPSRGSLKKPTAKPLRNLPRQKPEENKVCRSSSTSEGADDEPRSPPAPSAPRAPAPVPSFARNTVASSSRCMRTDPPAASRAPGLTRAVSQRQLRVKGAPEEEASKDSGTLRRAGSARSPRKGADSAEAPGASRETPPKGRALGERASFRLREACPLPVPEVSA
ncbi:FH2 domain-containing protein 1-like [Oryctolagus cuniculus]|uniref:FH2 domain-containing protein 1-like n=1 Tax=Oryctolagus cuniculus TaxID=9986 RepID=UPI0022323A7D|nr:FH2 domain-containing protein 1-like [Oryctolagus cuniculus]